MEFDTLCLSGGGIKGLAFIGALKYFIQKRFINIELIDNFVGTSIGAMICFLLSLGFNIEELINILINFNVSKLEPDITIDNLILFHGINDGNKIIYLLSEFLYTKYKINDISFIDHYKLTKKKLVIIGTNFSKGSEAVFNYLVTPNMSVITALRISISIPVIFIPVLYNNDYYIDGAFTNNFPLSHCNLETTLGLYIKNSSCNKIDNFLSLISGSISIFCDTISTKDYNKNSLNIININNYNQQIIKFNFGKKEKKFIIKIGYNSIKKYYKNLNYNICKSIIIDLINLSIH